MAAPLRDGTQPPDPIPLRRRWHWWFIVPVAIFAGATLAHWFGVWTATRMDPSLGFTEQVTAWDGTWYSLLAEEGYPDEVREVDGNVLPSTLGFYPLYPALIRVVTEVTGMGTERAGVIVAVACSAAALAVIWRLASRLCGASVATRAAALVAFAPGGLVLSMEYSEGTFLLFAALCLLALLDRQWWLAGVFGALGCLARPSGLALVIACAAAVYAEYRREDTDWRVLIATAVTTAGFLALPLYHLVHAGDAFAYWRTQDDAWGQHFDLGWSTAQNMLDVLQDPDADFNLLMSALALAFAAGGFVLMWRWRPPLPIVAYTVVIVGLAAGMSHIVSTWRFVMTAFPLAIAYARVLRPPAYSIALGISAAAMGTLAVAATTVIYTP